MQVPLRERNGDTRFGKPPGDAVPDIAAGHKTVYRGIHFNPEIGGEGDGFEKDLRRFFRWRTCTSWAQLSQL